VLLSAPLVTRALLGVTPVGRLVQGVALGLYFGCALRDWSDRRGIRKIAFRREFGADLHHAEPMPLETREYAPWRAETPLLYWLAVPRGGALILRASPVHNLQPMETPTD